jgi:hypothetical protein
MQDTPPARGYEHLDCRVQLLASRTRQREVVERQLDLPAATTTIAGYGSQV